MGLDIYVGPLCRYYSGDWQTIIQQTASATEVSHDTELKPEPQPSGLRSFVSFFRPKKPKVDPVEQVLHWRAELASAIGNADTAEWEWAESMDTAYETDKPGWSGYGAVQMWATYIEFPKMARPAAFRADWENDPAIVQAAEKPRKFANIASAELWLPVTADKVFDGEEPNGNPIAIGSVPGLFKELRALNDNSWRASDETIRSWSESGPDLQELDSMARWGFSIWFRLAEYAVRERVPMRLDY